MRFSRFIGPEIGLVVRRTSRCSHSQVIVLQAYFHRVKGYRQMATLLEALSKAIDSKEAVA
jgi:hypothetical protein